MGKQIKVFEFGRFHLDVEECLLLLDGQPVSIEPQVFKTLLTLVENNGHLCEKRWLIEQIWGDTIVEEGNLTRNIYVIRKVLGDGYIQTIAKRGYCFVVPVKELREEGVGMRARQRISSRPVLEEEKAVGDTDQPAEVKAAVPSDVRDQTRRARVDEQTDAGMAWSEAARRQWRSGWSLKAALFIGGLFAMASLGAYLLPRAGIAEAPQSLHHASFARLTDQPFLEYYPSLSPDGKSFAYLSFDSGHGDIYLQRVGGSKATNLTPGSEALDLHPAFSPDGKQIAFRSERDGGGIFLMGATGENIRRLTDFGFHPAWSPDGKYILCTTSAVWTPESCQTMGQIWLINLASGEKKQLITGEDAKQPQWSPHGHRIAYWGRHQGGRRDIWTMPASGGESVPVTNEKDIETNWNPIWSPDGNYLYYASDRGGSMNLWRVPIDETSGKVQGQPEPVTTPSEYAMHLSLSRDGRQMAYVSEIRRATLHRIEFDPVREASTGRPIAITQGSQQMVHPDLSPDGKWLAADSTGNKREDLFVIGTDGTGLRQLTEDVYKDRVPHWSPDGKRIAFISDRTGSFEIWTIRPDGSGLQQLTFTSGRDVSCFSWSPDGARLAYSLKGGDTFMMEAGTAWSAQTPRMIPRVSGTNQTFRVFSWSPDGRKLAGWYQRSDAESKDAFGITVYSIVSQQFEKFDTFGITPHWLGDSRRLIFGDGEGNLYLLDTLSKKVHQIYSLAPQLIDGFSISKDSRSIYFNYFTEEADIWLLSLP
jgi:Tol biopolymer transport system component/DNA-binding winged helix-turn-helix (wHTH) protein